MFVKRMFFMLTTLLSASCGPLADFKEMIEPDVTPPALIAVRTLNEREIELSFSEKSACEPSEIHLEPELEILEITETGNKLILTVPTFTPGQKYTLTATVRDELGNSLSFMAVVYGYNPDTPLLVLNEFTTRGSTTHPDMVELKLLSDGNMGGITLYQGTPNNWQDRLIFPPFRVKTGDFILVHFKPSGIPEEIDETEAMDASGGLDASDQAYDFWIAEGKGISGNNGVLSVYDRPGGAIIDGVLYSNRTSDSDQLYRGFGMRKTLERAEELVLDGGWLISEDLVRPEDGVNPEDSTATRSICRDSISTDTDKRVDWHIVPTRGSTFGSDNSDEIYQ